MLFNRFEISNFLSLRLSSLLILKKLVHYTKGKMQLTCVLRMLRPIADHLLSDPYQKKIFKGFELFFESKLKKTSTIKKPRIEE
ncbi:hypothetical protein BpHYR1_019195 [Brachionus plicatilis]|uniref:Uncharacterized protein n=1 Tax=Brachionus plicatilis TaxID=10195 RepID=A0A3M7S644_BRAPC|nr:hypothetical protein BpHYR1_019195 [Brachionus plicatilis]